MRITPFDPATATSAELEEYLAVVLASGAVDRPNDPAPSRDSVIGQLTAPVSARRQVAHWTARHRNRIVGTAVLLLLADENTDLATVDITVRPDHRRRGLGTALLCALAAAATGRETIMIEGLPEGGTGQAWADALGFAVAQRTVRQTLDLRGADQSGWRPAAAPGYRIVSWRGAAPDPFLASYAAARNAIRDAPHAGIAFTMPRWTPDRVREAEDDARARRCQQRVVAAVRSQSADVVGLTELEIYQRRPGVAVQQDTTVVPAHRGHRLGLCMKADNLRWLAAEQPGVRLVRTWAAADNVHMLRINQQLGFVVDLAAQIRQARLPDLALRLASGV